MKKTVIFIISITSGILITIGLSLSSSLPSSKPTEPSIGIALYPSPQQHTEPLEPLEPSAVIPDSQAPIGTHEHQPMQYDNEDDDDHDDSGFNDFTVEWDVEPITDPKKATFLKNFVSEWNKHGHDHIWFSVGNEYMTPEQAKIYVLHGYETLPALTNVVAYQQKKDEPLVVILVLEYGKVVIDLESHPEHDFIITRMIPTV